MSESQTWATVVKMSTSRTIIAREVELARRAVQADEEHAAAAARAGDRRGRREGRAAGLDHDVESDAVGELEQQLGEVAAGRRRRLVRTERGRRRQPVGVDVDRDDAPVDGAASTRRRR